MLKRLAVLSCAMPVLVLMLLAMAPVHAAGEPIYTPDPIAVPSGKGIGNIKTAIRKACFSRGWEVREIAAGHMQAKHSKAGRKGATYAAVLDIRYDAKRVHIAYKDSQGFDYDAASKTIGKRYNSWVRNLEKDIRVNLGAY